SSVKASAEDCCGHCTADANCKAFSHYLGVCYLKSAKGNPISKTGVRSAAIALPVSKCSAIEDDVDYSGPDLRSVDATAAEDCCAVCAQDSQCKAFSHYLGVCYLKAAKGDPIHKRGVRSAAVAESPSDSQCSSIQNDIDFSGGDLVTIPSALAEDCCAICKDTSGCKLLSHADGKCYLKNEIGRRISKAGVRSALVLTAVTTVAPTPAPALPTVAPTPVATTIAPSPAPTSSPTPVVPTTTATPRPTSACNEKRQRRSWSSLSTDDKELYLSAIEDAMRLGHYKEFISAHMDKNSNSHGYGSCGYFFWHRKFLLAFENMLRSLDPKYACLTLSYWDFTEDYAKSEQGKCKTITECCPVTLDMGGSTPGTLMSDNEVWVTTRPIKAFKDGGSGIARGKWHEMTMPKWSLKTVRAALFGSSSIANVSHLIETTIDSSVRKTLRGTFESCSITYNDGTKNEITPKSDILFRSTYSGEGSYPIEDNKLIGPFFTELPQEYYKFTDIQSLGYSFDVTSPIGTLYSTCGSS
ncbi:unnamed protein product, partial [Aphanomyces euteiches]